MKITRFLAVAFAVVALLAVPILAQEETSETKEAWKESGHSWKDGFRELGDALGKSIRGEEGLKEEWKDVGGGFKDAGRDTGDAVAESIDKDEE